jgi:hypothetical protein
MNMRGLLRGVGALVRVCPTAGSRCHHLNRFGVWAGVAFPPRQIASAMDKFEKQFEDLDVRSGYMESAIDAYVVNPQLPRQFASRSFVMAAPSTTGVLVGMCFTVRVPPPFLPPPAAKILRTHTRKSPGSSTSMSVPGDAVSDLINQVAAERGLELGESFAEVGVLPRGVAAPAAAATSTCVCVRACVRVSCVLCARVFAKVPWTFALLVCCIFRNDIRVCAWGC